jgi:hypothetical protein
METHPSRLRVWLFVMTGIFTLSLFLMLAELRPADSFKLQRSIILIVPFLIFLLSPVVLLVTVWWGISFRRLDKMEAWWWLSAPFSLAFPVSMGILHMWEFGHPLALLIICFFVAALSSVVWMLATIYQLTISKTTTVNRKNMGMMAVVLLAGILLFTLGR